MEPNTDDDAQDRSFLIAELCAEFEITPRALRFYEQRGLVQPSRCGVTRIFSRRDRARLQLLLRGKRFGFSLMEIKEALDLYDYGDGAKIQMQAVLPKLEQQLDVLRQDHEQLSAAIVELENFCQHVSNEISRYDDAGDNENAKP